MKQYLFTYALLTTTLVLAPKARAQEAVIDAANLAQNLQTAAQSIAAVEQLKSQLSQLQQTYEMFTNPTNILNMAPGMESPALENPMPAASSVPGLVDGTVPSSGVASTYYDQNHVYSPTDGSSASNQLNENAQTIANVQGIATTNLSAIEQRAQDIPELESELNSASSITQVEAINGRIAAESQFVQAQQAQAANLQVLASEQQSSQLQQAREAQQEDYTNTQSMLQAVINSGN